MSRNRILLLSKIPMFVLGLPTISIVSLSHSPRFKKKIPICVLSFGLPTLGIFIHSLKKKNSVSLQSLSALSCSLKKKNFQIDAQPISVDRSASTPADTSLFIYSHLTLYLHISLEKKKKKKQNAAAAAAIPDRGIEFTKPPRRPAPPPQSLRHCNPSQPTYSGAAANLRPQTENSGRQQPPATTIAGADSGHLRAISGYGFAHHLEPDRSV